MMRQYIIWLLPLCLLVLVSCTQTTNYAPIDDRRNPPQRVPGHYTVRGGDTLYSIAWRYGLDYRRLAAANNIASPYRIHPGQRLLLAEGNIPSPVRDSAPATASRPAPSASPPRQPATPAPAAKPTTAAPSQPATSTPARPATPLPSDFAANNWRWPATGRVIRSFAGSGRLHNGIDIAGNLGEPVHSAAAGVVVYAGSGLVGYGNLLIVKHSDRYLSAYAHNSRLLVTEGQSVKQGQHIADLGDSGTDRVMLHFEIRRDGKPVDPLQLLPPRG